MEINYVDAPPFRGRFLTRDPLGMWHDTVNAGNGQAFVGNNPVNSRDQYGLSEEEEQQPPEENREVDEGQDEYYDETDAGYNVSKGTEGKPIIIGGRKYKDEEDPGRDFQIPPCNTVMVLFANSSIKDSELEAGG